MGSGTMRARTLKASRDAWAGTLEGPTSPAQHSSLAADDQVFPAMGCSAIAWSGIRSSVDAFDRALALLDADGEGAVAEAVGELRSSFVHCSHALTVLSGRRAERVQHALRIAWTAFTGPDGRSASLRSLTPFQSPLVAREVRSLLVSRGFDANPRWHDLSSVRLAVAHLRGRVHDADLLEATVRHMWAHDENERPLRDDAVACGETVVRALDRALELWTTRGTAAPIAVTTDAGDHREASAESLFSRKQPVRVDPYGPPVRGGRRRRTT